MSGRRYSIYATYGSVTAAHDILRLTAKANSVTRVIEVHVTQDTDETSEMLPFRIARASTNGTGTAVVPNPLDAADTTFGGSCAYNLSSPATKTISIHRESCNILSGFHYVPTPEARPILSGAGVLAVDLITAPTNTLTLSVQAILEEEG